MATAGTRKVAREPRAVMVKMYEVTVDGKVQRLTEEQYQAQRARAIKIIRTNLDLIESEATFNRREHQTWYKEVHGTHWYSVGAISDVAGGAVPPPDSIWTRGDPAIQSGRRALENGRLDIAAKQLKLASETLRDVKHEWNEYLGQSIAGAKSVQEDLETTRNVSFAIAVSAAAVVAAPVVIAGAGATLGTGGLGLTGAALSGGTFVASATTITVGGAGLGAALRGGSNLVGQAATGDRVNLGEAWKETKEGAKRGAVDAGSTFVGGQAGKALGLGGKGLSFAQRALRTGVSGGAGGAFGGGLGSTLEGRGAAEIAKDTATGFASGFGGGTVSGGASHFIPNAGSLTRAATESATGFVGGVGGAYISGERDRDKLLSAGKQSAIQSALLGAATHEGPTRGGGEKEQQQRQRQQEQQQQQQSGELPNETKLVELQQNASAARQEELPAPHEQAKTEDNQSSPALHEEQAPSAADKAPATESQPAQPSAAEAVTQQKQPATQETMSEQPSAASAQSKSTAGAASNVESAAVPAVTETPSPAKAEQPAAESDRMFTPEEVAKHVEESFTPREPGSDVPKGAETPAVESGRIDDIRVKKGKVDAKGEAQRKGPRKADIEDLHTEPGEKPRDALVRLRRVVGKTIAETPLAAAWEKARAKVLKGRSIESLGRAGALEAYKKAQKEFWSAVREDSGAVQFLQQSGYELPEGQGAALLKVKTPPKGVEPLIVEERRISLDHSAEKALNDNWKLALDGDKLIFEFHRVNSFRDSIQRALRIGAFAPKGK